MIIGDFNLCEDEIDRTPQSRNANPEEALEELREIKSTLNVCDIWRKQNPHKADFTFTQTNRGTVTMSRIDRLYVHQDIAKSICTWQDHGYLCSDHKIQSCELLPQAPTKLGKGLWRLQDTMLKEPDFEARVRKETQDLHFRINQYLI